VNDLSPRDRLLRVLARQRVDRPPVLCTGGMMNAAITEIVTAAGNTLPAAHANPVMMAELASDVQQSTGFENLGAPFCLTVEAEALGSTVDYGSNSSEPKVRKEAFDSIPSVPLGSLSFTSLLGTGRINTVAEAISRLNVRCPDLPVVGNISGPVSTAASFVEPAAFLKGLRKHRDAAHQLLQHVTDFLIEYAHILCASGATVITIGDPTATGEILGPRLFAEFAVPYLNQLINGIRETGVPAIVHICGDISSVWDQIPHLLSDTISTDAMVDLSALKRDYSHLITMGNVSTFLLQFGNPGRVEARTAALIRNGIDIISPACGLSTSTALDNIRALTATVKDLRPCTLLPQRA
jgi:MtaA/CmuA family methyltransferase